LSELLSAVLCVTIYVPSHMHTHNEQFLQVNCSCCSPFSWFRLSFVFFPLY